MTATADTTPEDTPPQRSLWRLLNEARTFHPGAVRTCCIILALAFGGMVVLRVVKDGQGGFLVVRSAMLAYALLGAIVGPRFGWYGLRAYTVGLALMLPLTASYVIGMAGYPPGEVTISALGTLVPYVFLLSGWDFVITNVLLCLGHAVVFQLVPESAIPRWRLWGVQLGAMACGTAAGVLLVTFRALTAESRSWWQASLARERTLREFAETASASMMNDTVLETLAAAFVATVPGSACAFVVGNDRGQLRLAATAGMPFQDASRDRPPPPELANLAGDPNGEARTHRDLPSGSLEAVSAWLGLAFRPSGAVLLPLGGMGCGVILLLMRDDGDLTPERLLMWTAMAHESALTVAHVQAWRRLRTQEADARRLSEERVAVAEMRARFVTQASHEFRTPLAVILAASGSLERYGDRLTPEQRGHKLRRIHDAVQQMTTLLDDVLALGRAEDRTGTRQMTDLKLLCRSVLSEVQDTAKASHRLVLQCNEPRVMLLVERTLMHGVVSNLLTNAVKYSPDGGAVDLDLERRDDAVVIRVRDHGIGIPEEDRDQLFESFRRATNVGAIPGSGLGLAIVQRGVEAHDGTIRIDSAVGAGTTVEIVLPARAGAADLPDA